MDYNENWTILEKIAWALSIDRYANALHYAYLSNDPNIIKSVEWKVKRQCGSEFNGMKEIAQRLLAISNKTEETT